MTLSQFITYARNKAYIDNPELAEEILRYSGNIVSNAMKATGTDSRTATTDQFTIALITYFNNNGVTTQEDWVWLLKTGTSNSFRTALRCEYDEEYVEYGFLSVEDGGRGIEF